MANHQRRLTKGAMQLRHAVWQALTDLADPAVPVKRRVAEAAEALEALGGLADRLLAGVIADPLVALVSRPAPRRARSTAVH